MTDQQLLDELKTLGIDRRNARMVALIPLVQVAWADGRIQRGERKAILDFAARERLVDAAVEPVLERWLTQPPTHIEIAAAYDVIRELARRNGGLDSGITPELVEQVVVTARTVAAASGGAFGVLAISTVEKGVLDEIAGSLKIAAAEDGEGADWGELLRDLATGRLVPSDH